jgi:hypothetical protein
MRPLVTMVALAVLISSFARTALSQHAAGAGPASAANDSVIGALRAHATPFTVSHGELHGAGADSLARIARENQFLLVGEDHGMQEVPAFIGALFTAARPAGYRHLAVEIGPLGARNLERMMRDSAPQRRVESFLRANTPFSLPFFNWREESAMLQSVVQALPGTADVLWGLDQEFILAPTYDFERLAEIAPTAEARALALRSASESRVLDVRALSERNPMLLWMFASKDADVSAFVRDYHARAGSEAATILRELMESREIYQKYTRGENYASNLQRSVLMRRHFLEWYRAAVASGEDAPKVLFKFGGNHMIRGPSLTDSYELGTFVPEFALANGSRSFNMMLLAGKGTTNEYRPFGGTDSDKSKAYDIVAADGPLEPLDVRSFFAAATGNDSTWTLIDLRPVRAMAHDGKLPALSPPLKRALLSFDAIVIAPHAHASTLFF